MSKLSPSAAGHFIWKASPYQEEIPV